MSTLLEILIFGDHWSSAISQNFETSRNWILFDVNGVEFTQRCSLYFSNRKLTLNLEVLYFWIVLNCLEIFTVFGRVEESAIGWSVREKWVLTKKYLIRRKCYEFIVGYDSYESFSKLYVTLWFLLHLILYWWVYLSNLYLVDFHEYGINYGIFWEIFLLMSKGKMG